MVIFHSYVKLPEGIPLFDQSFWLISAFSLSKCPRDIKSDDPNILRVKRDPTRPYPSVHIKVTTLFVGLHLPKCMSPFSVNFGGTPAYRHDEGCFFLVNYSTSAQGHRHRAVRANCWSTTHRLVRQIFVLRQKKEIPSCGPKLLSFYHFPTATIQYCQVVDSLLSWLNLAWAGWND